MKIRVLIFEDQKIMNKYLARMLKGDEILFFVDVIKEG